MGIPRVKTLVCGRVTGTFMCGPLNTAVTVTYLQMGGGVYDGPVVQHKKTKNVFIFFMTAEAAHRSGWVSKILWPSKRGHMFRESIIVMRRYCQAIIDKATIRDLNIIERVDCHHGYRSQIRWTPYWPQCS